MALIKTPNPDDVALGAAIRQRRMLLGISQEKLADQLGITFQQVQKYEKGANRVSWSRLVQVSKALNCSIPELMGLAAEDNSLAGVVDADTLSVVRTMQATSPEKRVTIRRIVFNLVEG
ncbi:helix-turn-helix domain-containing protein [Pleomorphomonas koreensis]|uniref:helix-turn-helix domain-containing protein n=1 Tax=Pleomorphomonas koreensis TaxID=257440 RepID=UPI000414A05B|nr:helix-turn-helix transcriptional regulator [Pleomorphomonas koreensis]